MSAGVLVLASTRTGIADFLNALLWVYLIILIGYIVLQMLFNVGIRPPYSRAFDAVLSFLRDVCEPFLRLFRRYVPQLGGLDLSALFAIITVQVVKEVLILRILHG
ncbi:MAG TPA: YggT family protein [Solirubrobacteraceae bacterium]|jgi:YggT family protein|nr:YggT family protein [Solirubrobacteraceae bacterium]